MQPPARLCHAQFMRTFPEKLPIDPPRILAGMPHCVVVNTQEAAAQDAEEAHAQLLALPAPVAGQTGGVHADPADAQPDRSHGAAGDSPPDELEVGTAGIGSGHAVAADAEHAPLGHDAPERKAGVGPAPESASAELPHSAATSGGADGRAMPAEEGAQRDSSVKVDVDASRAEELFGEAETARAAVKPDAAAADTEPEEGAEVETVAAATQASVEEDKLTPEDDANADATAAGSGAAAAAAADDEGAGGGSEPASDAAVPKKPKAKRKKGRLAMAAAAASRRRTRASDAGSSGPAVQPQPTDEPGSGGEAGAEAEAEAEAGSQQHDREATPATEPDNDDAGGAAHVAALNLAVQEGGPAAAEEPACAAEDDAADPDAEAADEGWDGAANASANMQQTLLRSPWQSSMWPKLASARRNNLDRCMLHVSPAPRAV